MTGARKFPNDAAAARAARQFALENLPGYSSELLDVVELLVSELATNSVRHTESDFEVRVTGDPRRIRISVTDRGSGWPMVQRPDPAALSGRGLALVETLSSSWGISQSRSAAGGKTVWLVLDVADHQFRHTSTAHAGGSASRTPSARTPRTVKRTAAGRGPRWIIAASGPRRGLMEFISDRSRDRAGVRSRRVPDVAERRPSAGSSPSRRWRPARASR
ncbi:MAG TPA: ATP-binding protein [Solirubrobacteraceae bacterium]|nr:ATP-binding protein [Solirubrobacteraceae bacterium]